MQVIDLTLIYFSCNFMHPINCIQRLNHVHTVTCQFHMMINRPQLRMKTAHLAIIYFVISDEYIYNTYY